MLIRAIGKSIQKSTTADVGPSKGIQVVVVVDHVGLYLGKVGQSRHLHERGSGAVTTTPPGFADLGRQQKKERRGQLKQLVMRMIAMMVMMMLKVTRLKTIEVILGRSSDEEGHA